jgi:RNA polymerase sigma-70 factor (ECF subfamily)
VSRSERRPFLEIADDETLVARAASGDRDSMEVLLRRYQGMIRTVCHRIAAHHADGEDTTQLALIAVVRGIGSFDGRSRLTTWLHRVAVNTCLDELRRRSRRPTPLADPTAALSDDGVIEQVIDRADIDRALQRLSPDFRAIVVLRDLCGLDYDEIAAVLDLPPGTVRSRLARARAALRAAWETGTNDAPTVVEQHDHG